MENFENDDWWKTDARTIATGCPEYMKYSKRSPWIFAVIIIGVVFVFILPFVGIVLLFIGIISLISTIAKGNKCLDTITKEVYANGNVAVWWNESNKVYKNCLKYPPKKRTVSYGASEPIRKGSGNQSKSENIAADVVASYALGKAAQNVIKNAAPVSNVRRNPSTTSERGNQARE